MALILDGTAGITTPAISDSGNLTFTGTGSRILGDFSNATVANRVVFQTSTTNGNTAVGFIPNGTGVVSTVVAYNNSDPTNASVFQIQSNATEGRITSGITGTGAYLPMTFYTGGSERMRIDTSGNVGIGTSSPNVGGYTKGLTISASTQAVIEFSSTRPDGSSSGLGSLNWVYETNSAGHKNVAGIAAISSGGTANQRGGDLAFYTKANASTTSTERMRIDSSGNLLVGTTTVYGKVTSLAPNASTFNFASWQNDTAFANHMRFINPNGQVGSITTTGSATTYATSSDYRLKENIQPMQNALARNALLKPCTYQWKADGSTGEGFIAHELQSVCPNAVTGEKDAVDKDGNPVYQGVDTSFLVGHLVACINELKAELDELKAKVK